MRRNKEIQTLRKFAHSKKDIGAQSHNNCQPEETRQRTTTSLFDSCIGVLKEGALFPVVPVFRDEFALFTRTLEWATLCCPN